MRIEALGRSACVLIVLTLIACLLSCSDEDHVTNPFTVDHGGGHDTDLGAISGRTVNLAGAALAGVRLDVLSSESGTSRTGYANLQGQFFVAGLALDSDIVKFSLSPQTYNANYRRLRLSPGGELHFPRVMLLPVTRGGVYFANQSGSVAVGSLGSRADFPASSFITPDSTHYAERVAPYMSVTTIHDAHFAAAFPGEFTGVRLDGAEVVLEALGAVWIFVTSQAGVLGLAPDGAVTYRLGINPAAGYPFPETVAVWILDTATARWNEACAAELNEGIYEVEVASLGPICWATPAEQVCAVNGVVCDDLGLPIANANIDYRDASGRFRASVLSEEDGAFELAVLPSQRALVTPYLGSIAGTRDTINTLAHCPHDIAEPLTVSLPHYQVDLSWTVPAGDLDAYAYIFVEDGDNLKLQWALSYIDRGRLDIAPYAQHLGDARGAGPESIAGRRWYDGRFEYWVHDYRHRRTDALYASGAQVDLVINDQHWRFLVADAAYDPAVSDTSGWWHVFDILVDGAEVAVQSRQRFAPAPRTRP